MTQPTWESLWGTWTPEQREQAELLSNADCGDLVAIARGKDKEDWWGYFAVPIIVDGEWLDGESDPTPMNGLCLVLTAFTDWRKSMIVFPEPKPDYDKMVGKLGFTCATNPDSVCKLLEYFPDNQLKFKTNNGFIWENFKPLTEKEALALVYRPD